MNKIWFYNIFMLMGVGGLLLSCSDREPVNTEPGTGKYLESIVADYATRDGDEDNSGEGEDDEFDYPEPKELDDNYEATELLGDKIGEGSMLYFSQLVTGVLEPFQPFHGENANFPDGYDNLYKYKWGNKGYTPEWEEAPLGIGGYNFFPPLISDKMDWDVIKSWGINNNGYVLFAMFFPYDNQLTTDYQVSVNQNDIENLRKSNFIGAYHSSTSANTRLRFKLYHLMVYLKVTLYVPVYNDKDTDKDGNTIRTGFPADALMSAQVLNVVPKFSINWYAQRSSDTAPACSAVSGGERSNIEMYIPPLSSYENGLPPIVKLKTSDFYDPDDNLYKPDEYDYCYEITLSALFPAGQDYINPVRTWANDNILRFNMRQNIGEVPKRYVFNGNSDMGLIAGGDPITISQGHLQHLNLYLPRHGAAAILLGADVEKWKVAYNDNMGLQQDKPLPKEEPEPEPEPEPGTDPGTTD